MCAELYWSLPRLRWSAHRLYQDEGPWGCVFVLIEDEGVSSLRTKVCCQWEQRCVVGEDKKGVQWERIAMGGKIVRRGSKIIEPLSETSCYKMKYLCPLSPVIYHFSSVICHLYSVLNCPPETGRMRSLEQWLNVILYLMRVKLPSLTPGLEETRSEAPEGVDKTVPFSVSPLLVRLRSSS